MASGFALLWREGRWSAAEVSAASDTVAAALSAGDVRAGAVVAHQCRLDPGGAVALGAIAKAGGVLAPLHAAWTEYERDTFLATVRPVTALTGRGIEWPASGWSSRSLEVPGFGELTLHRREPTSPGPPAAGLGAGAVLATSGSDGVPRLVAHEWRSLDANAAAANERLGFGPGDRWLATLPWAHVGGLAVPLRAAAAGAAVGLASPRFDAEAVVRALGDLAITHVSLVPAMLHGLLDVGARPPGSLRAVLLGGAATPPDLVDRALSAGWPVALTYGLTEAGSQVATATPREVRAGERSSGRPLPGVQVRIRPAAEAKGDEAPGGESAGGEIEVRGPTLFHGYAGEPPRQRGAWFATGDLGRLDAHGRLEVTGRLRDRIVSGGANIDPVQVEAVLSAHPEVREAAVIGLPDQTWGQIVTAVIVGGDPQLASRVDRWCRERLSGARAPRRWEMVDCLPRTATGKVDRARLRARIAELRCD
ncbi:class I adenylate-forming enzyme family protein [Candidatus Palauibacter sp.]|uniref:class I adenylate-forming enzyme family protein n=1 Tax=Candidatus Palauibacter sp. TaxID=3101350 RepID=UPI003B598BAD